MQRVGRNDSNSGIRKDVTYQLTYGRDEPHPSISEVQAKAVRELGYRVGDHASARCSVQLPRFVPLVETQS